MKLPSRDFVFEICGLEFIEAETQINQNTNNIGRALWLCYVLFMVELYGIVPCEK